MLAGVAAGTLNAGANLEPFLDAVKESGSDGIRALAQLDRLAPEHGGPIDLSSYLPIIEGCQEREMVLCGGLGGRAEGESTYDDWREYARVAQELARVAPDFPAFALFEGPNEPLHYKTDPDPSPERYMRLHVPMYEAVKAAAPGLIVMNGGIGGMKADWFPPGIPKANAATWWRECYRLGIKPYVDAVNVHGYSQTGTLRDSIHEQSRGAWLSREIYRVDRSLLQVWSEFGWQTSGERNPISEEEQAQRLTSGMRWLEQKPWIVAAFWFNWQDQASANWQNTGDWMGLLRGDGSPKPSYFAFRDYLASR